MAQAAPQDGLGNLPVDIQGDGMRLCGGWLMVRSELFPMRGAGESGQFRRVPVPAGAHGKTSVVGEDAALMVNHWIRFNRDAFRNECPEMYYWLGFIFADGNVCIEGNKYRLSISVHKKDENHLRKFLNFVGYGDEKRITRRKDECARIRVNSKKIVVDVMKFGVTPNKSLTARPTNIPDEYIKYFILGIFDGDGSFCKSVSFQGKYACHSTVAEICGSRDIVDLCSKYFNDKYGLKTKTMPHCRIWRTYISSIKKIRDVFSDLYSDEYEFYLDRKREFFRTEIA